MCQLSRLAAILALLWLTACDGGAQTAARIAARQQAMDPPQLWLIERLDTAGRASDPTYVCADTPMREGFARTRAEIDGVECRQTARPVVKSGVSALRCEAAARSYAVSAMVRGDPARDFRLTVAVTPMDPALGAARQTHRFRRLGLCPAGWRIGDQGPPQTRP
jgi:hypothetical protein